MCEASSRLPRGRFVRRPRNCGERPQEDRVFEGARRSDPVDYVNNVNNSLTRSSKAVYLDHVILFRLDKSAIKRDGEARIYYSNDTKYIYIYFSIFSNIVYEYCMIKFVSTLTGLKIVEIEIKFEINLDPPSSEDASSPENDSSTEMEKTRGYDSINTASNLLSVL